MNVIPKLSESYQIQIYNIYAEKIAVEAHSNVPIRIDITNLPDGIYFIRIGNEIQKFVVLK